MELLYISNYQFAKKDDGYYSLPAFGNNFWLKYLNVFERLNVLGVEMKNYLNNGALSKITDDRINVDIIPNNIHPKDFKNDSSIKRILEVEIPKAEAILIKPSSRKGIMAIQIAEKLNKPYMIELTGDLKLTLSTNTSWLKRLYSPILHWQITRAIKNAPFGLYVTEHYLQTVYPIKGKMCGITDSVIEEIDDKVLEERVKKISSKTDSEIINIGLIGSYNGNRKGIDVAIKALSIIENPKIRLNLLYNGAEEDRNFWFNFADRYNIRNQIVFPSPKGSTREVMEWIDTQDLIILPSRSEGLPRCIVESMSRACPCITSNVCGMPELINNKWIHDPEDYKLLSSLISKMISDKKCQIEAAKENFENSKRFLRSKLTAKRDSFLSEFKDYCNNCK